jgi:hypothetical protein
MAEETHELRFIVYVTTYGTKPKMVKDTGRVLSKMLHETFGDRFRVVDHRSNPVIWDAEAHDFGLGEA